MEVQQQEINNLAVTYAFHAIMTIIMAISVAPMTPPMTPPMTLPLLSMGKSERGEQVHVFVINTLQSSCMFL